MLKLANWEKTSNAIFSSLSYTAQKSFFEISEILNPAIMKYFFWGFNLLGKIFKFWISVNFNLKILHYSESYYLVAFKIFYNVE